MSTFPFATANLPLGVVWPVATSLLSLLCASTALAQQPAGQDAGRQAQGSPSEAENPMTASQAVADTSEIIVTARKRQESLLNVPVIENVLPAVQLERFQVTELQDVTKLAPGLLIGTSALSIGQLVSIRGVGTSSLDPGIDQSVSLNIDGLSLGQGLAFSSGLFDLGQIEVLKGPQALFFGKSSPGGVLAVRTADPTSVFEVIGRGSYETEAHTRRGELIISGPLSSTLKARVAGLYSASKGYYYNVAQAAPGTGAQSPRYPREGRSRDYQIRGTVLWSPNPVLSARLKMNLVKDRTIDAENFQLTSCPDGTAPTIGIPFIGSGEDCRKDRKARVVDMSPTAFPAIVNGGTAFVKSLQRYGTLELNYTPAPALTATSVTGYYNLHSSSQFNTAQSSFAGPAVAARNPRFHRRDFTQEVRLNSDYSTPLNFSLGAFYQDGNVSDRIIILGNSSYRLPPILSDGVNAFSIRTYSAYGQGRWKVAPQLELAAGARYTDERRRQTQTLFGTLVASPTPRIHSSRVSPEVTLTYKPSEDATIFTAYKVGNKSGSFSIGTPARLVPLDNAFGDEKVRGFEAGIKSRLLDRQINASLTGFKYRYTGLQVGAVEPTVGAIPTIRTVNAGSGQAYGAELDIAYRPHAIAGLGLNGSVTWTHARFNVLDNVPCYGGQTIALGCNRQADPTTKLFFAQDLGGSRFIRSPDWQANLGINYELPVGRDNRLIFASNYQYTSKYLTNLGFRRDYFQRGFGKADVSLSLQGPDNRWEVALIGKNVARKLTASSCSNSNFAGGLLGGQVTGGVASGPGGIDEVGCFMDPGREVWLRLTLRPFN